MPSAQTCALSLPHRTIQVAGELQDSITPASTSDTAASPVSLVVNSVSEVPASRRSLKQTQQVVRPRQGQSLSALVVRVSVCGTTPRWTVQVSCVCQEPITQCQGAWSGRI